MAHNLSNTRASAIKFIKYFLILPIIFLVFASCQNEKVKQKSAKKTSKINKDSSVIHNNYYVDKGQNLQVKIDGNIITVPKGAIYEYEHLYEGIYNAVRGDSLAKTFAVKLNNRLYYTTCCDDVGNGCKGCLYVYDLTQKKFIVATIKSSAGIFFLQKNYIFCLEHPVWYELKQTLITGADIYQIRSQKFNYIKSICANGDMASDDKSITNFYNKNLKENKWRSILSMPRKL